MLNCFIHPDGRSYSRCLCTNCGSIVEVDNGNLKSGASSSCGCIASKGEDCIGKILSSKDIDFSKQYTFADLVGPGGGRLRFDFAFHKNGRLIALLEYQGSQHYAEDGREFGAEQRITDIIKKEYCKKHNIPLFEIRYDENIEQRINKTLNELKERSE